MRSLLANRRAVVEMTNTTEKVGSNPTRDKGPSPMLTISEASRVLNVHANTLRRWSARGLITEYRIGPGSHRRYKAEDIAALIMEQPKYQQARASRLSRH
jgi:excisionase family DNA binding protein